MRRTEYGWEKADYEVACMIHTMSEMCIRDRVMNQGYLGLDGTFVAPTAVSGFLAANGSQLGSTINGTLGFDTIASGSPNVFPDPIDLSQFTSAQFLGLGTATVATLASTAVITPANNNYIFGCLLYTSRCV